MPPDSLTTSRRNSSGVSRLVLATRFTETIDPLVRPSVDSTLLAASAARTSEAAIPCAAISSGLSQMRIAKVRSPKISARCTPASADSRGCTTRTR